MTRNHQPFNAPAAAKRPVKPSVTSIPAQQGQRSFSLLGFRVQAIILALTALIFYANTFSNENAFDDRMAITANEYVHKGTAGIADILTHDTYQSYLEQRNGGNQLAGGRYRPLSIITFALEQQFMGTVDDIPASKKDDVVAQQMHARHVVNVLLYMLSAIALLYFFRQVIFKDEPLAAFISAFIFVILPVHSEVVANVKGRDEILSVLFICLTFIGSFKYLRSKKTTDLLLALSCYFLALLSKEYGALLILLLPVAFYTFRKDTLADSVKQAMPYLVPLGLYLAMRMAAVSGPADGADSNIMNNPYLYASGAQKLATELWVMLRYIGLLFVPHPLIADYSFRQIPYTNFSNPLVWLSAILHISMVAAIPVLLKRRHILGFAICIYLLNLLLISNLFFNIGAPMGERLVYHASIGFAMAAGYFLYRGLKTKPISAQATILTAFCLIVALPAAYITMTRNREWKNDTTLFLADVKKAPNSALVNNNAAAACMGLAKINVRDAAARNDWFRKAVTYFDQALIINPKYTLARINRGLCYFNMQNPDKAYPDWDTVRTTAPTQPNLDQYLSVLSKYYLGEATKYAKSGKPDLALSMLQKSLAANPSNEQAKQLYQQIAVAPVTAANKNAPPLVKEAR